MSNNNYSFGYSHFFIKKKKLIFNFNYKISFFRTTINSLNLSMSFINTKRLQRQKKTGKIFCNFYKKF
jgi:hypothetical protein